MPNNQNKKPIQEDWNLSGDGDCYKQAVELAMEYDDNDDFKDLEIHIVHGLVTGTGGEAKDLRYGHAWVELSGALCADSSKGGEPIVVPAPVYYNAGNINPSETYRYTIEEARRELLKHKHYGPWHK